MARTTEAAQTWDLPIRRARANSPQAFISTRVAGPPTVEQAIDAWIAMRGFARSTARATHEHLESRRARGWRAEQGITTIDQLSAADAAAYVLYLRDRGAAPATLRKVKTLFASLAEFCAETPGYSGLEGDDLQRLRLPKLVERIPEALTEAECLRLIAACGTCERDRLVLETLLLAGLRLSELCELRVETAHLDSRPAYLHVRGTVHDPERPKNSEERQVVIDYDVHGFGRGYVTRLRRYIEDTRQTTHYPEVFLSSRTEKDTGAHPPLTTVGVQKLLRRLENATGIHCNPHKLRHTYATRCVDKGVPMFHLQDALGHRSLDMVRRYYTRNRHAQAEGFYRAFGASDR